MRDLYNENYKILLKETEEDINKWKHISCLWIERLDIVKNIYTIQNNLQIHSESYQNVNGTF